MKIALSTDHAGFELLKNLQSFLESQGHQCINYGPTSFEADDDYPDYIFPAAKAVAGGDCERAIIMGGSGQGEAIAANRHKGVRAVVYYGDSNTANDQTDIIRLSRQHNDANILSIGARFVDPASLNQTVAIWLETAFSGEVRHARRNQMLDEAR